MLKSFPVALLAAALMTAAGMSITGPAQAQAALAWGWRGGGWGWPGYGYGTGFGFAANSYAPAYTGYSYYPAYAYGYGSGYGYPASRYYSSSGGYGMWENPWYSAASHHFIRRHVPLLARAARHWQ